jgi:hypothetical protein
MNTYKITPLGVQVLNLPDWTVVTLCFVPDCRCWERMVN